MTKSIMTQEEKQLILNSLQKYGNMFHIFFNLGKPVWSNVIETLAISFSNNQFSLLINEGFWNSLTIDQKTFYIAHECLHIMLSHIPRYLLMVENGMSKNIMTVANISMDITINESLIKYYNFVRTQIDRENQLCWVDTIFKNNPVDANHNFEYYFHMLQQYCDAQDLPKLADSHALWEDHDISTMVDEIMDGMTCDELELLDSISKKGSNNSEASERIQEKILNKKIKKKKKWETIIHKWVKNKIGKEESDVYQWTKTNRRFTTLDRSLILPTNDIHLKDKIGKIDVAFYIDTSPSCKSYSQRFFDAAKSVPLSKFNVRFFGFSNYVEEIQLTDSRIPIGYGTRFDIIESSILKEYPKYPSAVFIVTDGYGNKVAPQIPERWFWFLTDPYYEYINQKSQSFYLKNFE